MSNKLKILIIGGGGREHAIGWKIKQSPRCGELFFAPGNGGTAQIGTNLDIKATDVDKLLAFVKEPARNAEGIASAGGNKIDLTLAIPDDPLALGIVDLFQKEGLKIFGPTKNASKLEWSKAFAKEFMERSGLPTAEFQTFSDASKAKEYLKNQKLPIVVKVSGLALGKGVLICDNLNDAERAVDDILVKKSFGEAGSVVVIEEFLTGPEISTHAFTDGKNFSFFPTSQDHKRIGEGDTGPNTGGMGTIAPLPFVNSEMIESIKTNIVSKTLENMNKEGNSFEGVLYPGLMLTKDGPKVLEYNARFGDPETQTYMRLLETDLIDIVEACIDGNLDKLEIKWGSFSACTVVLASGGYPGDYEKGKVITGIEKAEENSDIIVFHAGTKIQEGNLTTNGGRVLGVSAVGIDLQDALNKAYKAIESISFEGMQYRRDIGKKAMGLIR